MFGRLLWESFVRQRRRKALAATAILLGTTAITAMLALATTVGDRIHNELSVFGANLLITPKADTLEVKVGDQVLKPATGGATLHASDLLKLRSIFWANNITAISPELDRPMFVASASAIAQPIGATITGAWFDHDLSGLKTGLPQLHSGWKLLGRWPSYCDYTKAICDGQDAVVTQPIANRLHLRIGDQLFSSPDKSRFDSALCNTNRSCGFFPRFGVTGIVQTDRADDLRVFTDLRSAEAMGLPAARPGDPSIPSLENLPDALTRVEVSARTKPEDAFARKDPDTLAPKQREIWYCRPYANSIAYQIREAIPGADAQPVRQVEQTEGTLLDRISGLMWLISAAALLAAAIAVSAAMATAVLERRAEVGLMRSLGASRGRIASLFYAEAALLALLAGSGGYLLGSLLATFLERRIFGAAAAPNASFLQLNQFFNPVLLPVVLGIAILIALLGSVASIRSALRMDPSSVLRSGL